MDSNNTIEIDSKTRVEAVRRKICSVIIDFLIVFPITLWFLFALIKFGFLDLGLYAILIWITTLLISIFLYSFLLEGAKGQTLGKMVMNIVVIKEDGTRCNYTASFLRNLLRIILDGLLFYLIGLISIVFSERNQRWGDHLAGTLVVKTK